MERPNSRAPQTGEEHSMTRGTLTWILVAVLAAAGGCRKPVGLAPAPLSEPVAAAGARAAFDSNEDGTADFFTYPDDEGRVNTIGYDTTGDGAPDVKVDLDAIPPGRCRHLVIILDGVSYDLLKAYYDAGGLRVFHPPSRVVAPYPILTDLCVIDALGAMPAAGFEATYYDRADNKVVGGTGAYLSGKSKGYNRLLQYRCHLLWDAVGYLKPRAVWGKEMNDVKELFDARETREVVAYFASSAGMGTILGETGHRECLDTVERLVQQVLCETRGMTEVTLLADHGHSYTLATKAPIERFLKDRGWHVADRLRGPRDVAYIRFGLETYASFATRRPAELSADLVECEGVTLASFAEGESVVVLAPDGGRAVVRKRGGSYAYDPVRGDPLKLEPLLERLESDDGYYDADRLLCATVDHEYPTPLQRLWRAHFATVENPPDVIVSLAANRFSGAAFMARAVDVASTHGSLRRGNSVTFIMSTAGPLPPLMRTREIPGHMSELLGEPWPLGE
jgi:hypothetical protein